MSDHPPAAYETLSSPTAIGEGLAGVGYISTPDISMALFLAAKLRKPVLIEGPAGVGKTDLARSLASFLGLPLCRLQCYEGLDEAKALYEWKYGKQLLYTQLLKERLDEVLGDGDFDALTGQLSRFEDVFFSENFLAPRPLLTALQQSDGAVLLIDEIDKSDEAFEAFLLEILSEFQVTIPELGTLSAQVPPLVILTSNAARDLGDALKRRCLHLFIGFPDLEREQKIVRARVPGIEDALLKRLVAFVQAVRGEDLRKYPSISESVDWAQALVLLHAEALGEDLVRSTLNVLLKHQSDIDALDPKIPALVRAAANGSNS